MLLAVHLCRADRCMRLAMHAKSAAKPKEAVRWYERAVRLNPWEMRYLASYNRFLLLVSERMSDAGMRGRLLSRAEVLGREAVRWHPEEAGAHHMLGTSLWALQRLDGAEKALGKAAELDPLFIPIRKLQLYVARARGDRARAIDLERDLQRLSALDPG